MSDMMSDIMNLTAIGCSSNIPGISNPYDNVMKQGSVEDLIKGVDFRDSVSKILTLGLSSIFPAMSAAPHVQHLPRIISCTVLGITPPIFNIPLSGPISFTGKGKESPRSR